MHNSFIGYNNLKLRIANGAGLLLWYCMDLD